MLRALLQKFRSWLFRPQISSGTLTLTQRRIFILPTRQGLGFGGVLLLMLLGDINYNLSLGYVLTFLLATVGGMSMLHAFRNMAQLEIRAGHRAPVFAGDEAHFVFHFQTTPAATLPADVARCIGHRTSFDLPAQHSSTIQLAIPALQRGWLSSGRLTLYTEYPLGLFHAWSYLHFDVRCLVYPKPAEPQALPASTAQNGSGKVMRRVMKIFPVCAIMWRAMRCRVSHGRLTRANRVCRLNSLPHRRDRSCGWTGRCCRSLRASANWNCSRAG